MLVRTIAALTESIAVRVGALDPAAISAEEAKRLVDLGARLERLGHAVRLAGTARVAAAGAWQGEGDRSAAEWLARTTGTSMSDAIGTVKTAEQLEALPGTAAAVRRGDLSPAQTREVAGAASADPAAEARLLDHAKKASLGELRDECKCTRAAADPDPEATNRRIHAARHVRTRTESDGTFCITMRGTPLAGARIMAGIRHRADAIFREAHAEGRREPGEAYLFDAAEELLSDPGGCTCAAEAPAPADGPVVRRRRTRTPLPKGANAKMLARVDWPALVRGRVLEGETCEIVGIGPVPVSVVRELSKDAFVAAILTNGTDIRAVTHLGRKHTALQVSALQWRDPECARLGCNKTVRLEYDHRADWAATRVTEVDESDRLCTDDHRLKTEHGWMLVAGSGKRRMVPPTSPDHPLAVALRPFAPAGPEGSLCRSHAVDDPGVIRSRSSVPMARLP